MILALGPWLIDGEGRREIQIPFGQSAKPKLVMNMAGMKRIQLLRCEIPGHFYLERFVLDRKSLVTGRCDTRTFATLFSVLDRPLLEPGSKLELTVANPSANDEYFSLAFLIRGL